MILTQKTVLTCGLILAACVMCLGFITTVNGLAVDSGRAIAQVSGSTNLPIQEVRLSHAPVQTAAPDAEL